MSRTPSPPHRPYSCFLVLLGLAVGCCTCVRAPAPSAVGPERPNVVFILADDFGIVDAQGYAARFAGLPPDSTFYETPQLNRLMREGTSFSQAYATQLCSPTRAGLLTGKYAPRLGFMTAMPLRETYYNQALPVPAGYYAHDVLDHRDAISTPRAWDNATSNSALPTETAHDAGRDVLSLAEAMPDHHSAFLGKWHLGGFGATGYQPADQGFEALAWFDGGGSVYYDWRPGWNNRSKTRFPKMPQAEWTIGAAGPPTGEDYLTDDLTARALNFLDRRAATPDRPFFLYLSHFAVHAPYQGVTAEVDRFAGKPSRGRNGHNDPVYASMVHRLDHSVGAVLDKLATTGLERNTLVVFMSDNGGIDAKITPRGDGTDNRPFLGGKACLTEGGLRVPLVLRQPGRIAADRWVDVAVDYTDLFPTILAAAGYDAATVIEREQLDGRSLLPLVGGEGTYTKVDRYWHYPFNVIYRSPYDDYPLTPHSAVRSGDLKLIYDWHGRLHLYDLAADPYERNDLATTRPAERERLFGQLADWLRANVERRYWPVRNPDYDPATEVREEAFRELLLP